MGGRFRMSRGDRRGSLGEQHHGHSGTAGDRRRYDELLEQGVGGVVFFEAVEKRRVC